MNQATPSAELLERAMQRAVEVLPPVLGAWMVEYFDRCYHWQAQGITHADGTDLELAREILSLPDWKSVA
jgi:hypothetical protein